MKAEIYAFLEKNADAIAILSDCIFSFGEVGMQEVRSVALIADILEEHRFQVERGISGFPTAILATFGQGKPVIALHAEYDANPSNSQRSGVDDHAEIVPGAPGHCEGHNVNAAVLVAAALALRYAMEATPGSGTLRVFGAPAEEQLLSRPYFVRDGFFDDVDVAFHNHILDEFRADYGVVQSAAVSAEFTFKGEAAHAAIAPWKGRDALDAVVLMDVAVAQYREHMHPTMTAHRVITDGGEQPNVVSARASVWWYFRDPTEAGARALFEQGCRIANAAAQMTNCELETDVRAAVWPVRLNQTMAAVCQRNIESIGMPRWTAAEQDFARALQHRIGAATDGLQSDVTPLNGPMTQMAASNDCGDISWKVPMARIWFPGNVPHLPFHHWSAGAALATSIAHKGALAGAKALAASALDYLTRPDLMEATRETFAGEIGSTVYRPLLPEGQRPPSNLNAEVMERFRPAMEKHYDLRRPVFKTD